MILACPECSRPFEIADDQIAALVQIECPSCAFRMILDFEAANDPSLVEAGMKMASGWRSAADYHASFTAHEPETSRPHLVAAPEPEPEPEPAPVLEPEPIVLSRPGRTSPARPAAPIQPASSFEARPPAFDAEDTRIHEPAAGPPAEAKTVLDVPPPTPPVSEDAPTVVPPSASPRPHLEVRLDASMEEEEGPTQIHTPSLRASMQAPRTSDVVVRKQVVVAAAAEEVPPARGGGTTVAPAPTAPAEARVPPHTPPGRPVVEDAPAVPQRDTPARPRPAPRFESMDLPDEEKPAQSSALGTVVVVLLLLSALGLVGASLALENTWDPRPLLEKVYRQSFG